jgi:hypothetical protein
MNTKRKFSMLLLLLYVQTICQKDYTSQMMEALLPPLAVRWGS